MPKLTVRDVMDPNPVTVTTRTSFKDLAALLNEEERGAVPVVRGGVVVGLVTEADLRRSRDSRPARTPLARSAGSTARGGRARPARSPEKS